MVSAAALNAARSTSPYKSAVTATFSCPRCRDTVVNGTPAVSIHALAAGLRVKPSQVAIAAIESMGIALPSYDAIAPEQAVELDIHLSARDKSVVLGLLRDLRSSAQPRAPDETPEDQEEGRVIDVAFPPEHDPTLPPDINEVGVAAQQGQSEGRRLREQQDRDAEQGEAGDDED